MQKTLIALAAFAIGGGLVYAFQDEPQATTSVQVVEKYIPAPPSAKAEPEFGPSLNAVPSAPVKPVVVLPAVAAAFPVVAKPVRSPVVYAMIARRQCLSLDDPDAAILEIVAQETTVTTERMARINAWAARCAQLASLEGAAFQTEAARFGREISEK